MTLCERAACCGQKRLSGKPIDVEPRSRIQKLFRCADQPIVSKRWTQANNVLNDAVITGVTARRHVFLHLERCPIGDRSFTSARQLRHSRQPSCGKSYKCILRPMGALRTGSNAFLRMQGRPRYTLNEASVTAEFPSLAEITDRVKIDVWHQTSDTRLQSEAIQLRISAACARNQRTSKAATIR